MIERELTGPAQAQREDGRMTGAGPDGDREPAEPDVEVRGLPHAGRRPRWLPRTIRHLAELLIFLFVVDVFGVPAISGTHKALHVLSSANPYLPLAALVLEALSLVAYFQLTRSLLPKTSDPGLFTVSRIELSTLAVSHCMPAGSAVGYSLGYGLLTRTGVSGADTGLALATQGLGSAVMLNVIFWLALLATVPFYGFHPAYLSTALIGLMLMAAIVGLVVLFTKGDERARAVLTTIGAKLPFLEPETLPRLFTQLTHRLDELAQDRRQLTRTGIFAAANWLFDAGCLFICLAAFGRWVNPAALLVAYCLANILAVIPLTPGGLGVIETTVIVVLVAFGTPKSYALLGVTAWRLLNFWLPIPVGGAAYLSLRFHPPAADQAGLAARRAMWHARWRWLVEMLGAETPTGAIEEGLSVMDVIEAINPGSAETLHPGAGGPSSADPGTAGAGGPVGGKGPAGDGTGNDTARGGAPPGDEGAPGDPPRGGTAAPDGGTATGDGSGNDAAGSAP